MDQEAKLKHVLGKPRKFKSPQEMQKAIDRYFAKNKRNPRIMGLVLALDFMDRSSLFDYEGYGEDYFHIITRARARIADAYERDLRNKNMSRGCQFALECGLKWLRQAAVTHDVGETLADVMGKLISGNGEQDANPDQRD